MRARCPAIHKLETNCCSQWLTLLTSTANMFFKTQKKTKFSAQLLLLRLPPLLLLLVALLLLLLLVVVLVLLLLLLALCSPTLLCSVPPVPWLVAGAMTAHLRFHDRTHPILWEGGPCDSRWDASPRTAVI
jgi:hypothetical protein